MKSIHFSADDFADKPNIAVSGRMEQISTPMPRLPIAPFEATDNEGGGQQIERRVQEMGQRQVDGECGEIDCHNMAHKWVTAGEVGAQESRHMKEKVEGGDAAARNPIDGNFTWPITEVPRLVDQMGLSGENI